MDELLKTVDTRRLDRVSFCRYGVKVVAIFDNCSVWNDNFSQCRPIEVIVSLFFKKYKEYSSFSIAVATASGSRLDPRKEAIVMSPIKACKSAW